MPTQQQIEIAAYHAQRKEHHDKTTPMKHYRPEEPNIFVDGDPGWQPDWDFGRCQCEACKAVRES